MYQKLKQLVKDKHFVVYGDPAYPLRPLLMKPYLGASLTPSERAFNYDMSRVRQAVEWGFVKVVAEFAILVVVVSGVLWRKGHRWPKSAMSSVWCWR